MLMLMLWCSTCMCLSPCWACWRGSCRRPAAGTGRIRRRCSEKTSWTSSICNQTHMRAERLRPGCGENDHNNDDDNENDLQAWFPASEGSQIDCGALAIWLSDRNAAICSKKWLKEIIETVIGPSGERSQSLIAHSVNIFNLILDVVYYCRPPQWFFFKLLLFLSRLFLEVLLGADGAQPPAGCRLFFIIRPRLFFLPSVFHDAAQPGVGTPAVSWEKEGERKNKDQPWKQNKTKIVETTKKKRKKKKDPIMTFF